MRVTALVKRWHHHTASGGYDRLAYAIGATVIKRKELSGIPSRVARKIWNVRTDTTAYLLDYRFEDWLAEQQLLVRCLVDPPDVVHVLYGDEQLDLLLRWRKLLRCPLIVTFHLPAERVSRRFEYFQSEEINGIDAAIVLARSEIAEFQRWLGADKVVYVPHGIDTAQFRPDDRKLICNTLKLLVVGDHMRDWDVMHRVIDEANRSHLDVQFDVVVRSQLFPYFTGCSNITLHSEIAEAKLIELYRAADALFLPVKHAIANNAVLEALACGTPVIATDVGGIPDYITRDCGWLIPKGDVTSTIEVIKQLCVDKDIVRSRREKARVQALKFDWQRIAERLFVVYSAIHAGRSPSAAIKQIEQAEVDPGFRAD
jgi:glycosyltransferase involved in cell wall biosynthesis